VGEMASSSVGEVRATDPADALTCALAEEISGYVARNPRSRDRFAEAASVMPGGNTRTALYHEPFPLRIVHGRGCRLWDADDHEYIDFLGEFTAGIYGHSDPVIRSAVDAAFERGVNLSGHTHLEAQLASIICSRFPSLDLIRFTNSGTEANLMALAGATVFTGRRRILVFEGGYHGGVLNFSSGNSVVNVPHDFIVGAYNDLERSLRLIEAHRDQLAAILVEPMLGSGCIPADADFLRGLRDAATRHGALLIFDEVMTSRLSSGGRQLTLNITPDLTTLGKYLGGGMSFGAFGGRRDVMAQFDPRVAGALAHAGTFNNNVVTMSAGIAGLTQVLTADAIEAINARGDALRTRLNAVCSERRARLQFTGLGSLLSAHTTDRPIRTPVDTAHGDANLKGLFFFDMLRRGVYMARRGFMALSLPIGDAEIDHLVEAVDDFLDTRRDVASARRA
jgi:glutamate-1-semialdehyde 2,1-aminomutase